jgi:hypothetical protein
VLFMQSDLQWMSRRIVDCEHCVLSLFFLLDETCMIWSEELFPFLF